MYSLHPIGVVRKNSIRIHKRWIKALRGIEGFSHLIVVFWLHSARRAKLLIHPKGNKSIPKMGYFATRTPRRHNPIGVSVVRLINRAGGQLFVEGLDAWPGTPVLDVKPYTPRDAVKNFKIPSWVRLLDEQEPVPLRRYDQSLHQTLRRIRTRRKTLGPRIRTP